MDYYKLSPEDAIKKLKTDSKKGLTEKEVKKRRKEHGLNELKKKKPFSTLKIFFSQFTDFLVIILIIAAIISWLIGESMDATVIMVIVLLNAIFGFSQEYKAEKSLALLKKLSTPKTKVIRQEEERIIDAKELVPGDLVIYEAGDRITSDARVVSHTGLRTDESTLTGESTPVDKQTASLKTTKLIAEQRNMLFSGTLVAAGICEAIVVNTGMDTELGKIAELVRETKEEKTPLQKKLAILGKKVVIFVLLMSLVIFVIGFLRGLPPIQIFLVSVSLAVAIIPEGLPAVVTISLAIGVQKMLRRRSLIRKLKAVETLGAVTTICSDKTGTLTKNEMTVTELYVNNQKIQVTGKGYSLKGSFLLKNKEINPRRIETFIKIAASCNDATIKIGDPTEVALLVLSKKAGVEREDKTAELPFESSRKYMMTKHKGDIEYYKGAPEKIISMCGYIQIDGNIRKLDFVTKKRILNENSSMASHALRVLAMAYKKQNKMIFVGLAGMIDEPRKEARRAIKLCKQAGIRVMMITGDHKLTAIAVAEKIGIQGKAMEGIELENLDKTKLKEIVKEVSIFARVSPEHKVRILEALQENGEIVAMTGDGINDAPALKKADVSVAMSIKGTDVAREASDMVLLDDNFSSIVSAVKEGRAIYDNIKKFIQFLLSANFGELIIIIISLMLGLPLPLLPLQILWLNLVTDSFPALALGVDPPDKELMKRKPRNLKEHILDKPMITFLLLAGILSAALSMSAFLWGDHNENKIDMIRTYVLTIMIMFELFLVFVCKSDKPFTKANMFENKWLVGAVMFSIGLHCALLYTPLAEIFKVVALGLKDWMIIIGISIIGPLIMEFRKFFIYKENNS